MSFGGSFITLTADISDTKRGLYAKARVRTLQHPLEPLSFLITRLLTYCHVYAESVEFTQGLYDLKQPTLIEKDSLGSLVQWIDVGGADAKKLERSLRTDPECKHSIYFETEEQITKFCHHLKGSKTNWIKSSEFYKWDQEFTTEIAEDFPARPIWQISFIDSSVYLDTGSKELTCLLEPLNMWAYFQETILNA